MSRVININGSGKERNQLVRGVVLALRELTKQTDTDQTTLDLVAFIVLALEAISKTIDSSVSAWEKRGYWVKADRFRSEWIWVDQIGKSLRNALVAEDWSRVAVLSAQVGGKLRDVHVPLRNRLGEPWLGAWERLLQSQKSSKFSGTSSKNFSP